MQVDGHCLRVDTVGKPRYDDKRSVFVGNLPFDVTEDALREVFAATGTVAAVRIVRDAKTGAGKGFGFVVFTRSDSVTLAIETHNGQEFGGRELRVTPVTARKKKPQVTSQKRHQRSAAQKPKHTTVNTQDRFGGGKINKRVRKTANESVEKVTKKRTKKVAAQAFDTESEAPAGAFSGEKVQKAAKRQRAGNKQKLRRSKKVEKTRRIVAELLSK